MSSLTEPEFDQMAEVRVIADDAYEAAREVIVQSLDEQVRRMLPCIAALHHSGEGQSDG